MSHIHIIHSNNATRMITKYQRSHSNTGTCVELGMSSHRISCKNVPISNICSDLRTLTTDTTKSIEEIASRAHDKEAMILYPGGLMEVKSNEDGESSASQKLRWKR